MKTAYIADVHLGNHSRFGRGIKAGINHRCERALDVLREAVKLVAAEGCSKLVVLGDLFDSHAPPPQLIAATQKIFWEAEAYDDLEVVCLKGNHECVTGAAGDHSLGPLGLEAATVVDKPQIFAWEGYELWAVPFQPGVAKRWLPGVLQGLGSEGASGEGSSPASRSVRALALHLGIEARGRTPPWLRGAHDSVHRDQLVELKKKHEIDWVFAGNWHDHLWLDGDCILQVGALVPTGFSNLGMRYGFVAIHDTESPSLHVHELDGPRFIKSSVKDAVDQLRQYPGCDIYVESKVRPEDFDAERSALESALAEGELADGVVLPDGAIAAQSARKAASAARSAETMAEAVEAYLTEMAMPEGIDRDEVSVLVRSYLRA